MTYRLRGRRIAVFAAILIAAAVAVYLLVKDDDSSEPEPTGGAQAASVESLRDTADSVEYPVYWAGEQVGKEHELTITDEGNIFIRYLDPGVPVGSRDVASLTIGTYPVEDAYGALQKAAGKPGAVTDETPDGGFVVTNESTPESLYIAYPGSDYQIEVYDPDPERAREVATSGILEPL